MAAGDIALRMLVTADVAQASGAIGILGGSLFSLAGAGLRGLSNAIGNVVFGMRNLQTAGTIGTDALRLGAIQAGQAFWKLSVVLAIIGAAVAIGIGTLAVKAAGDFQQALLSLIAHAGLARSQLDAVSQSVLQMSVAVGRSPTQLAEALYPILSAFSNIQNQSAKSAIALDTLKMSFETVAGTTVNGTDVANAAVGTFNALGLATNNVSTNTARMTRLFDVMDKTVQLGNMQWDAYKNVVSKLAVAIQGTGISFNESQAALATMTNEGFSAQRASTYLSNTFTTLAIKTNALAAHAKKLGIEFDASKYGPMSLAQKIEYLNQITDGNKQKLLALMGNNSTALKTFNALSVGIGGYKSNLEALGHAQGTLKGSFDTASQGFKFQMQQIKAAGSVLLITIGQQLLPVMSRLVAQVTPLVTQFTQWLVKSGALKNAVGFLSTVLGGLVTGITTLVSVGTRVVQFFQQNEVALAALKATLLVAAVIIGVTMAIAFYSMAAAAWTAAVGVIAATWPLLLIVAIVIVVVAAIILAVQHWGQIAHWLQGIWAAFSGWFMGILGSIGNFFKQKWLEMGVNMQAAVVFLQGIVQTGFNNIKDLVLKPITDIVGFFEWLYNHNYYFKDLVDAIKNFFTGLFSWGKDQWNRFTGWLGGLWDGMKSKASEAWGNISKIIGDKSAESRNSIKTNFDQARNTVANWGYQIGKITLQTWEFVSQVAGLLWSKYLQPKLAVAWQNLQSFFNGWPKSAFQWGVNLIQGFINGIGSMLGAVGNAAQNIMGKVAGFLGFHSPTKEGPGRYADTWAPAFITMYTAGLLAGMPKVQAALAKLTQPLSANGAFALSSSHNQAFALSGSQVVVVQVQPTRQDIYLDKKKVGEANAKYARKEIHLQGGHRNS